MSKEEVLMNLNVLIECFADNSWNKQHIEALKIARECVQDSIDDENSPCYLCDDEHCENCLYSGRIPE